MNKNNIARKIKTKDGSFLTMFLFKKIAEDFLKKIKVEADRVAPIWWLCSPQNSLISLPILLWVLPNIDSSTHTLNQF